MTSTTLPPGVLAHTASVCLSENSLVSTLVLFAWTVGSSGWAVMFALGCQMGNIYYMMAMLCGCVSWVSYQIIKVMAAQPVLLPACNSWDADFPAGPVWIAWSCLTALAFIAAYERGGSSTSSSGTSVLPGLRLPPRLVKWARMAWLAGVGAVVTWAFAAAKNFTVWSAVLTTVASVALMAVFMAALFPIAETWMRIMCDAPLFSAIGLWTSERRSHTFMG